MKTNIFNYSRLVILLLISFSSLTSAQEISTGVDLVSKYIWRGADAGSNAPSIQPSVKYTNGGLAFGLWGATPIGSTAAAPTTEIDIYGGYTIGMANSSSLFLGFTDYTYPSSGIKYGNFNNYDNASGAGAHQIEINATYTGPESFPISVSANMFAYDIKNNPVYVQLGYTTAVKSTSLSLFAGATTGDDSKYYGIDKFGFVNIGFTASKTVKVTDSFSFPVFSTVVLNPATANMFYVIGISL